MSRALIFLFVIVASPMAFTQSPIPGEEGAARAIRNGIAIPEPAPDRSRGEGPFNTLLITEVTLISGGAAQGQSLLWSRATESQRSRAQSPASAAPELLTAAACTRYGFIDAHTHLGNTEG